MRFMDKKNDYGLTRQLLNQSIQVLLYLLLLYIAIYFCGTSFIDKHISKEISPLLNHRLKDGLVIMDIILCFSLYLLFVVWFIQENLDYIKYMIECIHLMKGGTFSEPTHIKGNNELSHLAIHIDELRVKILKMQTENEHRHTKQIHLLTSISHDLRTPLTSIIGYLEILSDKDYDHSFKPKEYLELCLSRALQLQDLINTAFELFYLTDKENTKIELLRCNAFKTLWDMVTDRSSLLYQKGFILQVQKPICRYSLVYDIRLMERLFDNIFTNVIRYAKPSSEVQIWGTTQERNLTIKIQNLIQITNNKNQSTGIGIKNCKKIMQIHKGSFTYAIEDNYFTATITLPIQNNHKRITDI